MGMGYLALYPRTSGDVIQLERFTDATVMLKSLIELHIVAQHVSTTHLRDLLIRHG